MAGSGVNERTPSVGREEVGGLLNARCALRDVAPALGSFADDVAALDPPCA